MLKQPAEVLSQSMLSAVRGELFNFYFEKISEMQSLADRTKNIGEYDAYEELLRVKRILYGKLKRRDTTPVQKSSFTLN